MEFPEDVIEYIAQKVDSNVRELEGVVATILAQSTLNDKEVNLGLAKEITEKIIL